MLKRFVPILLLIGLVAWGVYQSISGSGLDRFARSDPDNEAVGIDVGNLAPDFTLQTLSGESVSLSDFEGKHVIVNFWATWCPPCRAEMPDMEAYYEKHKENDFVILAVNLTATESNEKVVQSFVEELGLTFPIMLDEENDVAETYAVVGYPTSYFIAKNGVIHNKMIGAMNQEFLAKQVQQMEVRY